MYELLRLMGLSSSSRTMFTLPPELVPPVPALLPASRAISPLSPVLTEELLPTVHVSPATPEPTSLTAPPRSAALMRSPGWLTRPVRPSGVRGPRPLILSSASVVPGAGSGWPRTLQQDDLDPNAFGDDYYLQSLVRQRSRSNSCPTWSHSSESLSLHQVQ